MRNALIMGAAGRDFHNFNTFFRNKKDINVVAFTATQIPDIEGRKYPRELAGENYPNGIDIYPEAELLDLIKKFNVHDVYFSYSDLPYQYVMDKSADVMKVGANFILLGPNETMIKSKKPVVSVCAIRTGCGKSQTTRKVGAILQEMGYKVAAIRHPMPYGDLVAQKVQKFETVDDLKKHKCTIEEMEEYEPHIEKGITVFAGVDYEAILAEAEKVADIILWDGGNNDFSFYKSDLEIVVVDPHRAGHELEYYPGGVTFKRADVFVINKIDTADLENILDVRQNFMEF
ncbi:MAG: hypothetical protein QG657_44, partial [Acidobacteriota bacterium]|nr:hypothetical protein [Acidobacteriota bacterium]